jgi:hypothetical protein
MKAVLLQPRSLLREHWPWLVGAAMTALFELARPYALQQLAYAFQKVIVDQPLAAARPAAR